MARKYRGKMYKTKIGDKEAYIFEYKDLPVDGILKVYEVIIRESCDVFRKLLVLENEITNSIEMYSVKRKRKKIWDDNVYRIIKGLKKRNYNLK